MLNINLNQMGFNGTHKNKTYLSKEKNSKVHIRIGKCIWKNRLPPLKSKIKFEKKSLFMVDNRITLVPRTQRKKLELNPNYGYGAMSNNVQKCTNYHTINIDFFQV